MNPREWKLCSQRSEERNGRAVSCFRHLYRNHSVIEREVELGRGGREEQRIALSMRFICVIARYTVCAKRIVNGTRSNRAHQHGRGCKLLRQYTQRGMLITSRWASLGAFASRKYTALFIFPGGSVRWVRIAMILIPLHFVLSVFLRWQRIWYILNDKFPRAKI